MTSITDNVKYLVPRPLRDATQMENLPKLAIRLSILALGALSIKMGGHRGLVLLGGAMVSLPATLMGVGATVIYKGVQMVRSGWAKQSFERLTNGLVLGTAGYYILENYKNFKMYNMGVREASYNSTGRGFLEDYLSRLSGNWVFMD